MNALLAQLERRSLCDRSHSEGAGGPEPASVRGASRGTARDLDHGCAGALGEQEAAAGGQEREGRAGRCSAQASNASGGASAMGPPPKGPLRSPPYAAAALTTRSMPP